MAHLLWPWYICLLLFLFLCAKTKFGLGFCIALSVPISVTAIISWNLTPGFVFVFNFLFSKAQVFPPPMSTTSSCTAHCAKNILYQEATLKLLPIKFASSQKRHKNTTDTMWVCLCSQPPSVRACLCLNICFGQTTRAQQPAKESLMGLL